MKSTKIINFSTPAMGDEMENSTIKILSKSFLNFFFLNKTKKREKKLRGNWTHFAINLNCFYIKSLSYCVGEGKFPDTKNNNNILEGLKCC